MNWSNVERIAQDFNTTAHDLNPGPLSGESEVLLLSHCTLCVCVCAHARVCVILESDLIVCLNLRDLTSFMQLYKHLKTGAKFEKGNILFPDNFMVTTNDTTGYMHYTNNVFMKANTKKYSYLYTSKVRGQPMDLLRQIFNISGM